MPGPSRMEPRLVIAAVLVAIPLLWLAGQVLLTQAGEDCGEADHSQVGSLVQLFVPGTGCADAPPRGR